MKLRWPVYQEVVGVFVGGCVDRGEGSSFRAKAHAHTGSNGRNYHWICVRSIKRVGDYVLNASEGWDGDVTKPSRLMMHELAHILTDHGHDDIWRKKMREMHQPLGRQYDKKLGSVKASIVCINGIQYVWSDSRNGYYRKEIEEKGEQ